MEYDDEVDRAFGNIPEFGAIFLSNIHTKKECMRRRIFALPSSRAEFVKRIKSGMVLFLFEFRKRQLFGVYQASSDGAMEILPHAFNYSGRRFPAQVRFRQIWNCDPLSEKEFRDAIRENYFSASHFNFGLSKEQVRRLLYLFSSKKIKSKIPLNPRSEAIVEIAVKDRRWVGGSRCELSERGYMEADEYEDNVAFSDRHVSSLAKAKEDEVWMDDRVNAEVEGYPFPPDEFLAKKRRTGKEGRLPTNDVAENGPYNHGYRTTFCTDSRKDSFDEVSRSANSGRLLAAQMVSENQVDKSHYPVQSSDHFEDQLDLRACDDYKVMQWGTLLDYHNMHNGHQKAFASNHYGDSMGRGRRVVNHDRSLLDDYVKRDCNINVLKSMANGSDDRLNLLEQGHELLMNRKFENRHHLDYDGSSISAFDPSASLLHKIRKTSADGSFQIDESEPDFGTCSAEGFSPRDMLHPLQYGYGNKEHRNYPIVEGKSTENMVNKVPPLLSATAEYIANADRQIIDGRFRGSGRIDNLEVCHTLTNPVMSKKYPFSQQGQNLSSFSDKLFTEKHGSQRSVSRNFDLPYSTFDDATITRDVSCLPEYPNCSYGRSASIEANWKSTSMQKPQPLGGSLGDFYPPSSNRSQQYILESENLSSLRGTALEFGSLGFSRNTSGLQTSFPQESVNSLAKPKYLGDMDLNASGPVTYNGSLPSRLSPPHTDLEDFEVDVGLSSHPKSRDTHFSFHENNPEASEHSNQHVPLHGMAKLVGEEFSYPESEDLGVDICLPETLPIYENQLFRFSGNMNLKELHNTTQTNSTFNRRSVFTRLSSKVTSRFGRERCIDADHEDSYMDATPDEVMEMLQQGDDLSPRKFRKSRITGQPRESAVIRKRTQCNMESDHSMMENKKLKSVVLATADSVNEFLKETGALDFKRRSAVNENKTQCNMETDHSTTDEKKIRSASQTTGDGMEEIQKETRTLDFKRRSDRKKNVVGVAADTASRSKPTGANEQVKSSISSVLRRKKLVRPVFSRSDTDMDATRGNEKMLIPALTLDKGDKQCCEMDACNLPNAGSSNVLASETCQEMDFKKELLHSEEQKDEVAHVLPSMNVDLKGHGRANDEIRIVSSMVPKEASRQKSLDSRTFVEGVLAEYSDNTIKETSQQEISDVQTSADFVLAKDTDTIIKETSQLKSLDIQTSVGGVLDKDTDTTIKETSQSKSLDVQTSVEGVLDKGTDTTIKGTSQSKSLDIQTSAEGVLAKDSDAASKETSQPKSSDMQTCVEGVLAKDTNTARKETTQPKSLNIQTSVEGVLAKVTDTTIKETSHQKSLDVQTSFEGILAKGNDTTITCLNLPESSLEGFELGAGLGNNSLNEEKHLKKMKLY